MCDGIVLLTELSFERLHSDLVQLGKRGEVVSASLVRACGVRTGLAVAEPGSGSDRLQEEFVLPGLAGALFEGAPHGVAGRVGEVDVSACGCV